MKPIDTSNTSLYEVGIQQRIRVQIEQTDAAALETFTRSIQHPADMPLLLTVLRGAMRAFEAAIELIDSPNQDGLQLLGLLQGLYFTTEESYQDNGVVDVPSSLNRRLTEFQAWKTLAKIGGMDAPIGSSAIVGMGVMLGLALAGKKDIANGYCSRVHKDLENSSIEMESLLIRPSADPICHWHSQFYKFWLEFFATFSTSPLEEGEQVNIHRAVKGRWIGRSAYPSSRLRAGIQDSTCLSSEQVRIAMHHDGRGVFSSREEFQFALWLVGTSGAPVEAVHQIPVVCGNLDIGIDDDWSIYIDTDEKLLKRDYSALAKGAAIANKSGSEASSYIYHTHIPKDFDALLSRLSLRPEAQTIGDLIPALKLIRSEGVLYPSTSEFRPTWARWSRTLGALFVNEGEDTFLTATHFGDFGLCAKSKLFYASVSKSEAWRFQNRVYQRIGWGSCTATPSTTLNFGSRIVPSDLQLTSSFELVSSLVSQCRPARRRTLSDLVEFHNCFAASFYLRVMLRLSLRSSSESLLTADIRPGDLSVDLDEKSSQGRFGGMAAPLTKSFHEDLLAYRTHIRAFINLTSVATDLPGVKHWGEAALNLESVPLVCIINSDGSIQNLSSLTTLRTLSLDSILAADFGRKWNENAARLAGFSSRDIDRLLRHEVLGQETTSSISEGSEYAWSKRMGLQLDALHSKVIRSSLHGLRASI